MYSNPAINALRDKSFPSYKMNDKQRLLKQLGDSWESKVQEVFELSIIGNKQDSYADLHYLTTGLYKTPGLIDDFKKLPKKCQTGLAEYVECFSYDEYKPYIRMLHILNMSEIVFCNPHEIEPFADILKFSKNEKLNKDDKQRKFESDSYGIYREMEKSVAVVNRSTDKVRRSILLMIQFYAGDEIVHEIVSQAMQLRLTFDANQLINLVLEWPKIRDYPLEWSLELTSVGEVTVV